MDQTLTTRETYDCAVIGGGPAGLLASLYLKRYWRSVIVIDKGNSRAKPIPKIRNLVGYYDGISGADLLKRIRKQVDRYKTEIVRGHGSVTQLRHGFKIHYRRSDGLQDRCFYVKKVIIATGMQDVQPQEIANYAELCKKGLLAYCPICDGYDHSKQDIAILVDSERGLGKIKFISRFSPRLSVVMEKPFTWPQKAQSYFKRHKIKVYQGPIDHLEIKKSQKPLVIHFKNDRVEVDLAYVELGTTVDLSALKKIPQIQKSKDGFILVNQKQETSVPGIYAIGDCASALSQISVGIGHAATASTHIHNSLLEEL